MNAQGSSPALTTPQPAHSARSLATVTTVAASVLLLANAALLWRTYRKQQQQSARDCAGCSCCSAHCTPANATAGTMNVSASPVATASDDERGRVALDRHHTRPTGELFARDFTAFASLEPELHRSVRRRVYCRDAVEFIEGVARSDAAAAAAAASVTASAAAPASAAPSPSDSSAALWDPSVDWSGCSVVTSVPDVSETYLPLAVWRAWFTRACRLILERVPAGNVAIFYQTDVLLDGR